jgi:hypothetical protein
MRVMVIVKANADSEAGKMPSAKLLGDMMKFNEELVNAGIMLAGDGLHPSSKAKRVTYSRGKVSGVKDGPFAETKELIAGYWIWKVKSIDEAVEWAKRVPCEADAPDSALEIRPLFDAEDFGEALTPEIRQKWEDLTEKEAELRAKTNQ